MVEHLIVSPGQPYPVEARVTEADDPGRDATGHAAAAYAFYNFGMWDQWQEQHLSPHAALTYTMVWACVSYIAETVASLGWKQFERQGEGGRRQLPPEDPISWLIGTQASPEMNALEWRQVTVKDALLWGNGYSEIERDKLGRPSWLWRLDPARCGPERDPDTGELYYRVRNPHGGRGDTILDPANVFHLKGLSPDGLVGYSVVEMARRSIRLGLHQEQFGDSFFARGPMPGGMLEIPGAMKKQERDELRESFAKTYGGSRNAGRVVVLSGGAKFNALTIPNDDAQWVEGRTFQADEIARWFRVPPHKVGLLSRSTFSNIEQQAIEAVQDCLLPWCRRLECEADIKLFGRNQMGRRYTRLNLETLLRGDTATQTESLVKKVNSGLLMVNEGRALLDLNPIEGGDTPLVQGAMVPLDRVLEEPEPEPAPPPFAPPGEPGKNGQPEKNGQPDKTAARTRRVFRDLLAATYDRLLRVDRDRARRAGNKGELPRHVANYYTPAMKRDVASALAPAVSAFLGLLGVDAAPAGNFAAHMADDHCRRSVKDMARGLAALEGWGIEDGRFAARAVRQADEHLARLWQFVEDCGGPGSGVPGPCPGGGQEKTPGGSDKLHEDAEAHAKSWGQWAKELPGKALAAARDKIASKYEQLKGRYGKAMAIAIMGAGIVATPVPVPGTTFLAVAPLIAAGELYRSLRGGGKGKGKAAALWNAGDEPPDGLTDEEIIKLGKEWLAEILKEWQDKDLPDLDLPEE